MFGIRVEWTWKREGFGCVCSTSTIGIGIVWGEEYTLLEHATFNSVPTSKTQSHSKHKSIKYYNNLT